MPPVAVDEFQQALTELAARSGEAASSLVSRLGRLSAPEARAFITDAYPALLAPFLAASGQLATQWYAEQPTPERPAGSSLYVPEPARVAPPEQLAISGRWALAQPAPAVAISGASTRHVMNAGRDTVVVNAIREGTRYVRKAQLNACGFCKMLATRSSKEFGAGQSTRRSKQRVYSYKAEGLFRDEDPNSSTYGQYYLGVIGKRGQLRGSRPMGSKYHENCKCIAVPVRDGRYDPPDYVEQWTQEYDAIVAQKGTDNLALISKIMDEGRVRLDRLPKIVPAPVVIAPPAAPPVQAVEPVDLDESVDPAIVSIDAAQPVPQVAKSVEWDGPDIVEPTKSTRVWNNINFRWQFSGEFDKAKADIRAGAKKAIDNGYTKASKFSGNQKYGAEIVARAVHSEPTTQPWYRGITIADQGQATAVANVGQEIKFELSSFTDNFGRAAGYANDKRYKVYNDWQSRDAAKSDAPGIVYVLEPGAKIAELEGLSNTIPESIGFGRFVVTEVKPSEYLPDVEYGPYSQNPATGVYDVPEGIGVQTPTVITLRQVGLR